MRRILITGSNGLIGSELVAFFARRGWKVHGIDNNMRAGFFGPQGDTRRIQKKLSGLFPDFVHHESDVRHRERILEQVGSIRPDAVVHAAAQPSHDLASRRPFDDFDVNAGGTLNLLEASRRTDPEVPFIFLSTNKVYGDRPNRIPLVELETRWDYRDEKDAEGVDETMPVDHTLHSVFGASKLSADILVQEYGRYYGMPTCCLRCGCVTGPNQSGVELHGFLNYLVKCNALNLKYRIFGFKGKQVRDNIHAFDVAAFIHEFVREPRVGEVYNLGGGRDNSISILEAFSRVESISGKKMIFEFTGEIRLGDHICYISDIRKAKKDFRNWSITKDLSCILEEIFLAYGKRRRKD